jgi:hypothetical protein
MRETDEVEKREREEDRQGGRREKRDERESERDFPILSLLSPYCSAE